MKKLAILLILLVNNANASEYMAKLVNSSVELQAISGSFGSGVVVRDRNGNKKVLTNRHVCSLLTASLSTVITEDGQYLPIDSIRRSQKTDLCLVTTKGALPESIPFAKHPPKPYEKVTVIQHPYLLPTLITTGYIGKTLNRRSMDGESNTAVIRSATFISTLAQPGSSGSGVFNKSGELVALLFSIMDSKDIGIGYAFAVPYTEVKAFLETEE